MRLGVIGRRWLGGAAALAVSACSPARVLGDLAPDRLSERDVPYADGPRRMLDIYMPPRSGLDAPVVVFLYGGSWEMGDKATYRFVGGTLAARGLIVAIPDYRVYPEVVYPAFLSDCAAAVAWVGRRFPGRRLFVMGHSAGAYNAAMLGLDARWLGDERRLRLAGVIGVAGPYDFLPLTDPTLEVIFGPEDQRGQTQPIAHVTGRAPPMLLLAGTDDTTVRPGNTTRLAARIRASGGMVEERLYPGIGHIAIIGAIAAPLRFLAPTLRDCVAFIAPGQVT